MPPLSSPQVKSSALPSEHLRPASVFSLVALLIAFILIMIFLVFPQQSLVSEQKNQLAADAASQQELANYEAKLNSLLSDLQSSSNEANLLLLDAAIPLDTRISKVHYLLDSLAKVSGMTVLNINFDSAELVSAAKDEPKAGAKGNLKTIEGTANFSGTIEQFKQFLTLLETNSRIVDLDTIEVAVAENSDLLFKLKIKTYFFAE